LLKIALQKSGRLNEGSIALLEKCGLKVRVPTKHTLSVKDKNFDLETIFTRDDDIPNFIIENITDIGIIGENLLNEISNDKKYKDIRVIQKLNFAKCRLAIATPKNGQFKTLNDINGKTISTTYPNILGNFLKKNSINAKIVTLSGSVELSVQIGLADLICDLVESGSTLQANNLEEFYTIFESEAVLIANKKNLDKEKDTILNKLLLRINAVISAENSKYIMFHISKKNLHLINKILPGFESPTILDLKISDKVAVHVVSKEDVFWDTIEKLKEIGATAILVTPIEKMIE
jgi:ATP phosphoribosyltransferase